MDENTQLLREIRDLLRVMAEPELANRDKKLGESLSEVVGKSKQKAKAVLLMDGSKSQAAIRKESGMDQGNLSRFVTSLRDRGLIGTDGNRPKLAIYVSSDFFEKSETHNG
jgi:DNA-binding MarR family transcriptional regulator